MTVEAIIIERECFQEVFTTLRKALDEVALTDKHRTEVDRAVWEAQSTLEDSMPNGSRDKIHGWW